MPLTQSALTPTRFRDEPISFASGLGQNIDIPSASPRNYHQVISKPADMPKVTVDGKLFLPAAGSRAKTEKLPLVMIVPGSLGVAPSHLAHAETLTAAGFATFVLDSFGARGVTSTVANQTQFSFAASAYDVLAALKVLSRLPGIDATKSARRDTAAADRRCCQPRPGGLPTRWLGRMAGSVPCSPPIPGVDTSSAIPVSAKRACAC